MSLVEWTEPQDGDSGVDHLGMRVAGERAYSALIDFTTTVTWRPRYLSYLCWSLREAWRSCGGGKNPEAPLQLDRNVWRRMLKRCDYLLAGATLAVERGADHIAGSIKVNKALDAIGAEPGAMLTVATDHLAARTGSHEIYLGILRVLGLVVSAQGIDIPTARGDALADAFQASLNRSGAAPIFAANSAAREDLERLGQVCGLYQLAPSADVPVEVAAERRKLREQILDWGRFHAGRGPSAQRVLSIGLLLAIFRLFGRRVELDEFRATVLLDAVAFDSDIVRLELPAAYDELRARWRCYQAHAYATYALEALLGVMLARAFAQRGEREGVPYEALLDNVVESIKESGVSPVEPALSGWPSRPLGEVMAILDSLVLAGRTAPELEPELHQRIGWTVSEGDAEDLGAWAHDASLLLLLSIARLLHIVQLAPDAWIGDRDPQRLPPRRLIEHVEESVTRGWTAAEHLHRILHELVVRQHQRNALRKLAADPRKFTAKLAIEQGLLIPLLPHQPGTSNPRFDNAVVFLQDLGYINRDEPITMTPDGEALLEEIAERSPS
jgi:hypothetical protein